MKKETSSIAVFAFVLTVTTHALANESENQCADWPRCECSSEFTYNSNHPLTYENLHTQSNIDQLNLQHRWKDAGRIIENNLETFVAREDIEDNDRIKLLFRAITYFLTRPTEQSSLWYPDEPDTRELILLLQLSEKNKTDAEFLTASCSDIETNPVDAAVIYTTAAFNRMTGRIDDGTSFTADIIEHVAQSYENKLFNGLKMWPWELWANGLLIDLGENDTANTVDGSGSKKPDPKGPSSFQLVFMRPSLSPVIKFDGNENSELDGGLIVEPLGYVHYLDTEKYDQWVGLSPMIGVTGNNGIGYGGLVRYNNFQLGAAYHEHDSDMLFYVSVDLYDLLIGEGKPPPGAGDILTSVRERLRRW